MADPAASARNLIEALDEPALLVAGWRTLAANQAARDLLGKRIEGGDLRLAIRHPEALALITGHERGELDLVGIGTAQRPWRLTVRPIGQGRRLVRLSDLSASRAAEVMRVDFVANASHELRTPLATIGGYAETLAEDSPLDDPTRRRFGEMIQSEAKRMLRIVEDLMSLSRIAAERFVQPREPVDLADVARRAAGHAEPLCARKGCSVRVDAADRLEVAGDPAQLLQAVDNLVANAIRYGCRGETCTVVIEVTEEKGRALIAVRDNGDGIAAEHLPRLTERFYRVDAARSRDSGGTGLGLAIVKHIVERHRGTLDIRSTPGHGTSVEIRLPLS